MPAIRRTKVWPVLLSLAIRRSIGEELSSDIEVAVDFCAFICAIAAETGLRISGEAPRTRGTTGALGWLRGLELQRTEKKTT